MRKLLALFFIVNSSFSFSQDMILELNKISEEKFILDGVVSDEEINEAKILEVIYEETPSFNTCLLYTSPSPRDKRQSRMPSSA